jgi:hypothetical protein
LAGKAEIFDDEGGAEEFEQDGVEMRPWLLRVFQPPFESFEEG